MGKERVSILDSIRKNKEEILKDKVLIEKIEKRVEEKVLKSK
ncbi:FbpB family small basic protein [Sporosarcina sp. G11-34]|nr:FbpB family small basic protein [Sporosarcina sp. G11-34]MCZ2259739.1 FbpB family small basic protein [Sporosarcina sp. G11-34]